MKKWLKRTIVVVSVLLVILITAGFFAGNYFFNLALNPNTDKSIVLGAEHNQTTGYKADTKLKQESEKWFSKSEHENVYLQSYDNLKLHGYYIQSKNPTNKWVIICHGYGGKGSLMTKSGMQFDKIGFHILMPDSRGCGESEGDYIGMGWDDRHDVVSWIQDIIKRDKDAQIVLYGVSMGGATVMMVSGEDLPSNVKAIVEDCGYTSVYDEFSYQLKEIFGMPAFPIMNFSSAITKIRAGFWLGEASAIEQVAKSVTPIMFIHGSNDTFVPSSMLEQVYEAANSPKEKFYVEGARHGEAAAVAGEEYWKAVSNFINQYLTKE